MPLSPVRATITTFKTTKTGKKRLKELPSLLDHHAQHKRRTVGENKAMKLTDGKKYIHTQQRVAS